MQVALLILRLACLQMRGSQGSEAQVGNHTQMGDTGGVQDFGLQVPIDAMMAQLDKDASGTVEFKEFRALLE